MKLRSITLSVFVALLVTSSCKKDSSKPPAPNPDPELLGPETAKVFHYSFNGNLNDSSGNSMNAVHSTNITYTADRFGRTNQAVAFGGPSNFSSIATPSPASKITGFPFSISIWFKAPDVSRSQTLLKADGGEYNIYSGYWLQLGVAGSGTMSFSFGDNTGTNGDSRNSITTPEIFTPNTWYHVVINVRAANDMDFYINGVKNNSCTYSGNASSMVFCTQSNQLQGTMGLYMGSPSIFEGIMDDYRIYTKILSQTEVATLYNFHP